MEFLDKLIGKVPEVPVKVTVENETLIKLSISVVIVATIIILLSTIFKK